MLQICTVGGVSEVGKNMTAIRYGNEVVILDLGFHLPTVVEYEEEEGDREHLSKEEMMGMGMIPNDEYIESWKPFVKAIVCSHCHLDHVGAVPYMAQDYDVPVYGTLYTIEVIKTILKDERIRIPNDLTVLKTGRVIKVSENLKIELIHTTHSTLDCAFVAVHTPEGVVFYANDFKLDNTPTLGKRPDYKRMKQIAQKGVVCLIFDALYSDADMKCPSEKVAREMLKEVMDYADAKNNVMIVTSFASHIARLKSVIEFGKKLRRKIVILGRSMNKYITAAEKTGFVNFRKDTQIIRFGDRARRKLKQIQRRKDRYLIICTGSQGEQNAILTRMARHELPFKFHNDDAVIFSTKTIPAPDNIANRAELEKLLKQRGARIFKDVHVSGHAALEDHRELIQMLKPEHIIPAHGPHEKVAPVLSLAKELDYMEGDTLHFMEDGEILEID